MSGQGSKKINFNKSTLFSLKAELMKKQEEVLERKQQSQNSIDNFVPAAVKSKKNERDLSTPIKKSFKERLKEVDVEEMEACRRAKVALEKKAELYEHLSDSTGNSQLAGRFLVDFNTKKRQEETIKQPSPEPELSVTESKENEDESDWTEFTDCLGRTRKCLKTDLELYLNRDAELIKSMRKEVQEEDDRKDGGIDNEQQAKEKPFLVQKTNDYLQSLRAKWEEKESELIGKDKDIHYQDLLFDEARIHGVAYYSFSTDETERQKQLDELIKRRQETLRLQQEAEAARKKRDDLMAARVAAARARQRARAGLPPEEPKENTEDFTNRLLEFLTQQKNEADAKAKEEELKTKEAKEKERQKLRETHVREWDVGKGDSDRPNKFREMSQEEYIDQQRSKRIKEFAPSKAQSSTSNSNCFDNTGKMHNENTATTVNKTWSDVRPTPKTPPPPDIGDLNEYSNRGLYFTTNKKSMKYTNFVKAHEPIPIINEVSENPEPSSSTRTNTDKRKQDDYAEIPPPPTFDYYGPVPKQWKPNNKPFDSDIREAYAQGAKSLESKSRNLQLPQHYDFTFD